MLLNNFQTLMKSLLMSSESLCISNESMKVSGNGVAHQVNHIIYCEICTFESRKVTITITVTPVLLGNWDVGKPWAYIALLWR